MVVSLAKNLWLRLLRVSLSFFFFFFFVFFVFFVVVFFVVVFFFLFSVSVGSDGLEGGVPVCVSAGMLV